MSGQWPAGRPPPGGSGGPGRGPPPFTSWGAAAGAPGAAHSRQELAKQAAQQKRKQQAAQAAAEQRRKEGSDAPKDLFAAPTRALSHDVAGDVERVFGSFHEAHRGGLIHNTYRDNCFGVDYQPPTPAPAREHIIGEEEDEPTTPGAPATRPPAPVPHQRGQGPRPPAPRPVAPGPRPPGQTGPRAPAPPVPLGNWGAPPIAMAPPAPGRGTAGAKGQTRPLPQARTRPPPLNMEAAERRKSSNSSFDEDDHEAMLSSMLNLKHQLQTPLTEMAPTPRVEFEEMGTQRHRPVYQVDSGIGFTLPGPALAPLPDSPKAVSEPPRQSSSSESSSESDSEEEDAKDDFSLATIVKNVKNSPRVGSMSDRSTKPTPSPRDPTPSPGGGYILPSPSLAAAPTAPPPSLLSPLASPLPASPPPPALRSPEKKPPRTLGGPSSEDEADGPAPKSGVTPKSRTKQVGKKSRRPSSSSSSRASAGQTLSASKAKQYKSEATVLDDSDSDSPPSVSRRRPAVSPQKRRKASSPARGQAASRKMSGRSASASRGGASGRGGPGSRAGGPRLSSGSDSEAGEEAASSPAKDTAKKISIKKAIFGGLLKQRSGGRAGEEQAGGKGKAKPGKGQITVVKKDEEETLAVAREAGQTSPAGQPPPPPPSPLAEAGGEPAKTPRTPRSSKAPTPRSNKENTARWANTTSGHLTDDLNISEDDSAGESATCSPSLRLAASVTPRTASATSAPSRVRPRMVVGIRLDRLGKTLSQFQSRLRTHAARLGGRRTGEARLKQEVWVVTPEEERGRKRKTSEAPQGRAEAGHRTVPGRTGDSEGEGGGWPSAWEGAEAEAGAKRLRGEGEGPLRGEGPAEGPLRGEGPTEGPPAPEAGYPGEGGASWPSQGLMPPPTHPPQRVYYSYFERRHQDEAFEDEDNVVEEAKRLKHEADGEANMETKCRKYLQAIMLFTVSGSRTESMGDKINAYNMYNQTLHLIKYVMKLTTSKNAKKDIDIRLVVMSLRAQSLLNLRLYKMKRHELKDYQRTIQDALAKSGEEEGEQPAGQISPTPSPAGSEGSNCSKSSGYTSSGEQRLPGVLTPPTAPPICLSIPKNVMQNQFNFCSYLSQCHELWEQADLFVSKGQCEDFFILLDQECGPLTLHSSLKDLVAYTRRGLSTLCPAEEARP